MVKLSISDEQTFGELRGRLTDLHLQLTPATERFAPIDVHVRGLIERLSHFDPTVRVAVVGHPRSGKSTLVNSMIGLPLLPPNTTRELCVVPFSADQPMIRRQAGKAIASGLESCREHLISEKTTWIEEFADRRLHASLPLINGTHCYASNWVLVDTVSGSSAITPTLSSVASRIHTPNVFVGDFIFYCVDSTLIGTDREQETLDFLTGEIHAPTSTLQRLADRTTFVLTHADVVLDAETCLENIHRTQRPVVASIVELRTRFKALFHGRFGVDLHDDQLLVFSGRNALAARRMLLIEKPAINEVYDYAEMVYGSQFMQTIDEVEEAQLLRIVKRHAESEGMVRSGANSLIEALRLIDFHAVRHLMASIATTGTECTEQLLTALRLATPQIQEQVVENQELLEVLLKELEWTVDTSDTIEKFAVEMHNAFAKTVEEGFDEFFRERLRELRFVLEHRELAWFRERQHCTVVEMAGSLRQLEAFTERYLAHRAFLEAKQAKGESSSWEFIDQNISALLHAMEKEKQEHLLHFSAKFAHHIKDEFSIFVPQLAEKISGVREGLKAKLIELSKVALRQTERRMGRPFPLDEALRLLDDVELVERNDRRTNNFLRDLPEHVAVAAVEVSQQWYVPAGDAHVSGSVTGRSSISATPSAANSMILAQFGEDFPPASSDDASRHDDGVGSMKAALRYVLEAWRLSCLTIRPHQLCTYNLPAVDENIAKLNEDILSYIRFYVDSLEAGIAEQQQLVRCAVEDKAEVAEVHAAVTPLVEKFNLILLDLNEQLVAFTVESAQAQARKEEAEMRDE